MAMGQKRRSAAWYQRIKSCPGEQITVVLGGTASSAAKASAAASPYFDRGDRALSDSKYVTKSLFVGFAKGFFTLWKAYTCGRLN